jgi:hypothetical protein
MPSKCFEGRLHKLELRLHLGAPVLQIMEADLEQALTQAVICTILAAAGPQRSRVLANLYKDERSAALPVFPFLEKVYLERILRPEEVGAPSLANQV